MFLGVGNYFAQQCFMYLLLNIVTRDRPHSVRVRTTTSSDSSKNKRCAARYVT
jgi:hypothetical protein